ncbi:hypothetical protein GDO81_004942 [Engystomops pustulosus]|uniref:Uncharacterized protein n=1 Tax=Engystomops pustulosus TaxID=76066 RepID=A0AAV7CKL6_ENGPU|nr:hypothetical protein GDO81_004942 [Engystomops pustulosus]
MHESIKSQEPCVCFDGSGVRAKTFCDTFPSSYHSGYIPPPINIPAGNVCKISRCHLSSDLDAMQQEKLWIGSEQLEVSH